MATMEAVCITFLLILYNVWGHKSADDQVFQPGTGQNFAFGQARSTRFLLYDVNPGEGFNLRRDVYMRVANLVKMLNEDEPWAVVLPPWGRLYHWKSSHDQSQIRWSTFFDLPSLNNHVPVIEFEDYLKARGEPVIDEVYYLQRYKEGWTNGKWQEKIDVRECLDPTGYEKDEDGHWRAWFWGYEDVIGKQFKCLSVQAESSSMKPFLLHNTTGSVYYTAMSYNRCVFLMRAEQLIHGQFSEWSSEYWTARRSMVFAKHLREIGDAFRREQLASTDEADNTIWEPDWTQMERQHGEALGGPYVAVHMRRRDFLYGHNEDVPSIAGTAKQLRDVLTRHNLTTLFVCTDAPKSEYEELRRLLKEFKVTKYQPSAEVQRRYKDGGVAIIDQWIAAHARYFIGTSVSTFSFRIHEEREILGFDPVMTFNRLCGDNQKNCEQPTKWTIKY